MKQLLLLLLLMNMKMSFAQSLSGYNSSMHFISSLNNSTANELMVLNAKSITAGKHYTSKNICPQNNPLIYSNDTNEKKLFNPFSIQQINFTWSAIKFRFQFDVFATANGVIQKINLFQFQNQLYK